MKNLFLILLVVAGTVVVWSSCSKYKDVKGPKFTGTNHYCNDPIAANYNWGFPGIPDNTVCIYPTDLFVGKYMFRDSISILSAGVYLFIRIDSYTLNFYKLSDTTLAVTGFCGNGDSLYMKALPSFVATVDTTEGDSVTNWGQKLCSIGDTVNGTFTKDRILDSFMYLNLQVASDTGVISIHVGTAKKTN